ncbi:helix-turn-helix domain-containing protein [Marinobacter alexandrii]|uniref:AraC family transcriptional regulator n=1 Tax=Marinobacter alexandrii TaxID=2570351 RepID=UPI001FFF5654|nr:AraC family transcriptional regulator [Marinobacter alexandrii]MCK2148085.1 helix-turn-helix domain-containing protein [Marinobacter alexandrii]
MKKNDVPFTHNIGVQSSDFEEARCFINSRIDDREVSPLSASGNAKNLLTWQPLGGTTLFGAQWSEKVHIQSGAQSTFHAVLALSGSIHCNTLNKEVTDNSLLLIAPGKTADLVWEKSARAVVISLSRQALIDHLGIPNLEFLRDTTTLVPHNHQDAQILKNGIQCLAQQHQICGGNINIPVQKQWESLLVAQLANQLSRPGMENPTILPGRIRLAVEWILTHLREPISVCDLLRITGVSRRSLESGFRSCLNTTPAKFILCHKLKGVRETLRSDPEISIGDAAFSYGFNHLSHFTKKYQETFGELPSETVRQRREAIFVLPKKTRTVAN